MTFDVLPVAMFFIFSIFTLYHFARDFIFSEWLFGPCYGGVLLRYGDDIYGVDNIFFHIDLNQHFTSMRTFINILSAISLVMSRLRWHLWSVYLRYLWGEEFFLGFSWDTPSTCTRSFFYFFSLFFLFYLWLLLRHAKVFYFLIYISTGKTSPL